MNAETKTANARLQRIKIVSRIARWAVFCFFGFTVWLPLSGVINNVWNNYQGNHSLPPAIAEAIPLAPNPHPHFFLGILSLGSQVIIAIWYWKLAGLFRFYERGLIFAAETIHALKVLGILCATSAVVFSINKLFFLPHQPPIDLTRSVVKSYRMGLFNFDFGTGIDFGALLAGVLIVMIAWIMDEGRKIQEEQALTV